MNNSSSSPPLGGGELRLAVVVEEDVEMPAWQYPCLRGRLVFISVLQIILLGYRIKPTINQIILLLSLRLGDQAASRQKADT